MDLTYFITEQTPGIPGPSPIHPSSVALAYQLSNLYGLLFLLGVAVCYTTSEPKVLRNYLFCLAIADVSHVGLTAHVMGWDAFVDVGSWNALVWGNLGVTGFLFLNRLAYLAGFFGQAQGERVKVD